MKWRLPFLSIFGSKPSSNGEHAVLVWFRYGSTDLARLVAVEEQLEEAINLSGTGEFDGNEVAVDGSDGRLYMYGPNADKLFDVIVPILRTADFMRGAQVTRRYGPPGDSTRAVTITLE